MWLFWRSSRQDTGISVDGEAFRSEEQRPLLAPTEETDTTWKPPKGFLWIEIGMFKREFLGPS